MTQKAERSFAPVLRRLVAWLFVAAIAFIATGAVVGYQVIPCTSCHAMRAYGVANSASAHAGVSCSRCHITGAQSFSAPLSGMRWSLGSVLGRTPGPMLVHDGGCRRCHVTTVEGTVAANGVRVRHADFADERCSLCHAGSGHALKGRIYAAPTMEQCTSCHRTSATSPESCQLCHVGRAQGRTPRAAVWRTIHGKDWKTAHGLGDMKTCTSCHVPTACSRCHGIALPHPPQWHSQHGKSARSSDAACVVCHKRSWCDACHGIRMPHESGFIAKHEYVAKSGSGSLCLRCHDSASCDACHLASSHPNLPGVGMMPRLPSGGRR